MNRKEERGKGSKERNEGKMGRMVGLRRESEIEEDVREREERNTSHWKEL